MPFGRVGLSGPERALPGRYRVRPSRKREGDGKTSRKKVASETLDGSSLRPDLFELRLMTMSTAYGFIDNLSPAGWAPLPGLAPV